ncbi:MAG: electron transporter RnfD [Lachnospiraceae bacterium]|nr:electron transporter RnfD [Lachnospiraceae bacterium]
MNLKIISPDAAEFIYSGRIDFTDKKAPVLIYAASFFKIGFTGNTLRLTFENHRAWAENSIGVIVDGKQGKITLKDSGITTYDISEAVRCEDGKEFSEDDYFKNLSSGNHEIMVFKRQDGGQHYVTFYGMEIGENEAVSKLASLPSKKLEVIGDSVSCGEVCEALDYVGKSDPENNEGRFSNSYYSYSWQVARALDMELHDTSQGGISLLDKTGWFNGPEDFRGVKSCYDMLKYNPPLGENHWDYTKWIPDVIILAFGQNDANPVDIMKEDYDGEKACEWRREYEAFIKKLRAYYPGVTIVCATTLLMHDPAWDKAIEEVVSKINKEDGKATEPGTSMKDGASQNGGLYHFMYKRNGAATPGHPRIPEHNEMAAEMTAFIHSILKN